MIDYLLFGWEIKNSKIFMISLRGLIISLRGLNLIGKVADLLSFAIDDNRGSPFLGLFVVPDASVF